MCVHSNIWTYSGTSLNWTPLGPEFLSVMKRYMSVTQGLTCARARLRAQVPIIGIFRPGNEVKADQELECDTCRAERRLKLLAAATV